MRTVDRAVTELTTMITAGDMVDTPPVLKTKMIEGVANVAGELGTADPDLVATKLLAVLLGTVSGHVVIGAAHSTHELLSVLALEIRASRLGVDTHSD